MAKYYISCGTLQIIYSTPKSEIDAACTAIWELNDNDTLDEFFYIDERGFRGYDTATPDTIVFETPTVLKKAGWSIEDT